MTKPKKGSEASLDAVQSQEDERDQQAGAPPEQIRPLAVHELDRLEPLWLALHEHHLRISPRLAGMTGRSAQESWARRRANYIQWVKSPETFVLVAEANHELVGYAFVTVSSGYSSWNSGERQAQLETLSVAPSIRGQGVGERLLATVRDRLANAGIESISLSAACSNDGAHRFYERHGFQRAEVLFVGATAADRGPNRQTVVARERRERLLSRRTCTCGRRNETPGSRQALPNGASGSDQPEGTTSDVADSPYHLHPDVATEDDLAHDVQTPTSALDVLERGLLS